MQYIWEWQDTWIVTGVSEEGFYDQDLPVSVSPAWWEDVADALSAREGRLNLS